ncbi:hypothetical protein AYI68_g2484 [Smittium mucronatum]|uniref:Uncharacterized protein n=1 Tax=Smittium mucronatum TaxID=133383 RepID=A0A1R0H2I7_9FUNG|nr:hypothetical protein AYI68_g2484 [Smittium mucronatum]
MNLNLTPHNWAALYFSLRLHSPLHIPHPPPFALHLSTLVLHPRSPPHAQHKQYSIISIELANFGINRILDTQSSICPIYVNSSGGKGLFCKVPWRSIN